MPGSRLTEERHRHGKFLERLLILYALSQNRLRTCFVLDHATCEKYPIETSRLGTHRGNRQVGCSPWGIKP
jgi:hypothetical protein